MKTITNLVVKTSILSSLILLSACDAQYKQVINKDLGSDQTPCILIPADYYFYPMTFNEAQRKKYTPGGDIFYLSVDPKKFIHFTSKDIEDKPLNQYDALVKAGLFTKEMTVEHTFTTWGNKTTPAGDFQMYKYTLTPEGKKYLVLNTDPMQRAIGGDQPRFCYSKKTVDAILSSNDENGITFIKYSYKYPDVATWATNADVQKMFPEIDKALNNPDKTGTAQLQKN